MLVRNGDDDIDIHPNLVLKIYLFGFQRHIMYAIFLISFMFIIYLSIVALQEY
jgi:hypothetical protein